MPLADEKKVQTVVNLAGEMIVNARADLTTVVMKRDALTAAGASVVGTPLEGQVATFNTFLADLDTLLEGGVADAVVDAIVPSHRGEAL